MAEATADMHAPITSEARLRLRRVGIVLLIVGLIDIAYMIFLIWKGEANYESSFNIFAIIAGLFLLQENLRAALIVGSFMQTGIIAVFALTALVPLTIPYDLLVTSLSIVPPRRQLYLLTLTLGLLVFLFWANRHLQSDEIRSAMREREIGQKWPWLALKLRSIALIGITFGVTLSIAFGYVQRTQDAQMAQKKVSEEFGPEYQYYVSSLSISQQDNIKRVDATVIAYSASDIQERQVSWTE